MDKNKNQDKENVKAKTRIPVRLAPPPALTHHALNKLNERPPLNTVAGPNGPNNNLLTRLDSNTGQCFAGTSNSRIQKSPWKFDIYNNFVTVLRGCGFLTLPYSPYQDDKRMSESNVIYVSSDDEHDTKEKKMDKEGLNKRQISASTPVFHTLQPVTERNIKRSLKRSNSSELQRITPLVKQEIGHDGVKRRLNYNQTVGERMQSPDFFQKYMTNMDRGYSEDILSYLLQVETKPVSLPRVKSEARACVINWLMKINGDVYGNPATIQTAVWYLDAVLATGNTTLDNMQLEAAAAYWIATKIHGPITPASRLVKYANHAFTAQRLLQAEKIILIRLKYPRHPVIPQDYLYYFASRCDRERPGEIAVATTFLCLCGMMANKSLCREYPSVVAAASARNALLLLRQKELMPRLKKCPAYVAAEKKAGSLFHTCAILRHAVRVVAAKDYSYKSIFEQYGRPPKYIAQKVASAAKELAYLDPRSSPFKS